MAGQAFANAPVGACACGAASASSLAALSEGAVFPLSSVIAAFCTSNILLTLLQWYWTSLILKAVIAKAMGQPDIDPDEMEGEKRQKKRL